MHLQCHGGSYADTGISDGIQIDKNGNVYAGCGGGVQVRSTFRSILFFLTLLYLFIVLSLNTSPSSDVLTESQVWKPR